MLYTHAHSKWTLLLLGKSFDGDRINVSLAEIPGMRSSCLIQVTVRSDHFWIAHLVENVLCRLRIMRMRTQLVRTLIRINRDIVTQISDTKKKRLYFCHLT